MYVKVLWSGALPNRATVPDLFELALWTRISLDQVHVDGALSCFLFKCFPCRSTAAASLRSCSHNAY